MPDFDIAVIGAAPAGATTALMLARMGASVVMVDRSGTRPILGETLPPNANPILHQLGLWERFLDDGHRPGHGNRSLWGSARSDHYDFIRSPYGSGWHIDRPRFDSMFQDAFFDAGGILYEHTRLLSCHRDRNGSWLLTCAPSRLCIRANFVVDATGRSRKIARSQGIPSRSYDRLIGIIGVARPSMAASPFLGHTRGLEQPRTIRNASIDVARPSMAATTIPVHDVSREPPRANPNASIDVARPSMAATTIPVHDVSREPPRANPNVGGDREPALHSFSRHTDGSPSSFDADGDSSLRSAEDSFTTVESAENGWWYSNPLPDGLVVLGYMTDPDLARQDNALHISGWNRLLSQTTVMKDTWETGRLGCGETGLRTGGCEIEAPLQVVPGDSSCLENVTGDGWLAVGDAAAAYDPLSSQGILSGMIEGMWAAGAIAQGPSALLEYQDKMHHAYARYLAEWMSYYAQERRWPVPPFWRRRHALLESLFAA